MKIKNKKWYISLGFWVIFEAIAVILWLTKDNLFYLFNFSYIGTVIAIGLLLFQIEYKHARRIVQLFISLYMVVYLGLICNENMQIEGFWYYLFTGVFEAATIHYAVAKIFGPLIFGRGWCGYACWTAMVLDFLPYKIPQTSRKKKLERIFMQNPNHLMPREMILDRMWDGNGNFVDDNTLSVYIRRLRNKIEDTPNAPKYLLTERGIGYKWVVE